MKYFEYFLGIILVIVIWGIAIILCTESMHNDLESTVLEAVAEFKAEIAGLRDELEQHNKDTLWWEGTPQEKEK